MNFLTINAITDTRTDPETAETFDAMVQSLARVLREYQDFTPTGDLQRAYVQFQFDCGGLPDTVRGMRVARYSKKHQHIEAYVEVTLAEFRPLAKRAQCELLSKKLREALQAIERLLEGKVRNNVSELVPILAERSRLWCEGEMRA